MCGIAGIVHWGDCPDADERVEQMVAAMRHRGPDDQNIWGSAWCMLGHTRLSILDLTGGMQPMANEDGKVVVVYNGEIYNHRELRRELEQLGHVFKSNHSDTEILVHGYESWGENIMVRLNGMFAFAIWDQHLQSLFLGRDRYGIKPLYVSYSPNELVIFASEIRAILASGLVPKRESVQAVIEYLSFQNMVGEQTPFEGIQQFPAGHWERISRKETKRTHYWDFTFPRSNGEKLEDAAAAHRAILRRVIARQTDADVPVMTYLSGGIDSSAVSAAAFSLDRDIRAYSCLFDLEGVGEDKIVDEREFARTVARHLEIEHMELELSQDSLQHSLDQTIASLEYPRMGMSYVNYLIAQRVARDAKVVLSGMGGDEIHGGYLYRYQAVGRSAGLWSRMQRWYRKLCRQPTENGKEVFWEMLNFPVQERQLSQVLTPEFFSASSGYSARARIQSFFDACPSDDPWDLVMYVDAKIYLHGLLIMEDKLSMAHSLETRVPLLDNELVDFVLDLPWSLLCDDQRGKVVFRESVKPWVPDKIYSKPKMGFGPPDASWYRGALRDWLRQELSEKKIKRRGVFNPSFVKETLEDHFQGKKNNLPVIWSLLSFESWCRVFGMFGGNLDNV